MSLEAGDRRCHGRSFFDGAKERMTQKASVSGSHNHGLAVSVCFSQRLFLEARMHHRNLAYKLLVACHVRKQPLTRDRAMCNSKEAKLATVQPMYFCPHCLGSVLV